MWEANRDYGNYTADMTGKTFPQLVKNHTADGWLAIIGGQVYRAGAALLDPHDVSTVLQRSAEPLLSPDVDAERVGIVGNVVFPTVLLPHRTGLLCFYGMADSRIGAARLVRSAGYVGPGGES